MKTKTKYSRKGFVLVSALLITSISLLLLMPYASGVLADLKLTSIVNNSTVALNLAEAGAERAIWEIKYNGKISNFTISVSSLQASTGSNMGEYEVTVTLPDSNSAIITSYGYVPNKLSYKAKKTIKVILDNLPRSVFTAAVASLGTIKMTGSASTDSYDSSKTDSNGNLVGYNMLLPDGSYNKGDEGDMITNKNIDMTGSAIINGDARTGPGYPFSGNATGATGTLSVPITAPAISSEIMNAAKLATDYNKIIHEEGDEPVSGTVLSITGSKSITIPEGTYYFTKIKTTGTSVINTTGMVKIYVDGGAIDISGSGIINNSQPKNLIIYSTGTAIDYTGSADLRAAIYAPNAYFRMTGSSELYGSVICGSNTDTGSSSIHRDLDLLTLDPFWAVSGDINYTWQEM
ncbi:MAG: hypothetical protein NTZ95_06670 [Candidatus Omnitrophica bacterium]|nr:hypothetical protein [Candidatus Omnitrophota bacterium]